MRIALPGWKPAVALAATGALSLALIAPVGAQTNNAPTPVNDVATTPEDTAVNIAVLANDTDPESNTLSIASVGTPPNGTVAISGNSVIYTPKANFNGTDTFSYAVSDGSLLASAQVTVTVTPVNDAPVATDDTVNVTKNQAKVIDVRANDTDVDGNTLTLQTVTTPGHGTAVIADGKVTYTPATDYVGTDTFTYVISDGSLTETGVVNITVKAATSPVGDHNAKVLAACTAAAGQPGISTLCNLYTERDDLPVWARYIIGKNILKIAARSGASDRVLEACASAPAGSAATQLCTLYQAETTPSWLRAQVGKLILKLTGNAGVSFFQDRDDDDRKEGKNSFAAAIQAAKDKHKNSSQAALSVSFNDDDDDDKDDRRGRWSRSDRDDDDRDDRRGKSKGRGFGFAFGRR